LLGLYYLSIMIEKRGGTVEVELHSAEDFKRDPKKKEPLLQGFYRDLNEVEHSLHEKTVGLHSKIKYRWEGVDESGKVFNTWYETTPGRVLSARCAEEPPGPFDTVNKLMRSAKSPG